MLFSLVWPDFDPTEIEPTIYRTEDFGLTQWLLPRDMTTIVRLRLLLLYFRLFQQYFIYIVNVIFTGGGNRYTEKITIVQELYLHLQRSTSDHIESEMISAFSSRVR
jgi:hypothetical protein